MKYKGYYPFKLFNFKQNLVVSLFSAFISTTAFAGDGQTDHSRFFKGFGFSVLSEYESSPVAITKSTALANLAFSGGYNYETVNNWITFHTFTVESCSYVLRYNVFEMNNNMSVSIATVPSFSLSVAWDTYSLDANAYNSGVDVQPGFLSVDIPVFAEFNYGNISTFNADKEIGFVFGIGGEITKAPLFLPTVPVPTPAFNSTTNNIPQLNTNTFWFEPALEIGYRYWSKANKAREINLKYGFGSATNFIDKFGNEQSKTPWTIKLTWIIYTNY